VTAIEAVIPILARTPLAVIREIAPARCGFARCRLADSAVFPDRMGGAARMPAGAGGRSVADMSSASTDTLQDGIAALGARLARLGGAAATLDELAGQIRHGAPPPALLPIAEELELELTLAAHELDVLYERITLEVRPRRAQA
jgi:hypothetical protein